jgi:hypothetical protein
MLIQLLKAGAALTIATVALPATAASSLAQDQADARISTATDRVATVVPTKSGLITPPLPAPGTWPILMSGVGMLGYAARRRPLIA